MGSGFTVKNNATKNTSAFYPDRWYKRLQENEISREAKRVRTLQDVDDVLHKLKAKYSWNELYIFGSVAKAGKFGSGSDVDIAVGGLDKLKLYSFIGDVSLMLMRDVDVIRLEECPFALKIKKDGIPWPAKTK